jgi:hypothetical protein
MHFLTSLIIFSGFVLVVCLGLVQLIWDLSEMNVHASPHILATPHSGAGVAEEGHVNANAPSAADLRDAL